MKTNKSLLDRLSEIKFQHENSIMPQYTRTQKTLAKIKKLTKFDKSFWLIFLAISCFCICFFCLSCYMLDLNYSVYEHSWTKVLLFVSIFAIVISIQQLLIIHKNRETYKKISLLQKELEQIIKDEREKVYLKLDILTSKRISSIIRQYMVYAIKIPPDMASEISGELYKKLINFTFSDTKEEEK